MFYTSTHPTNLIENWIERSTGVVVCSHIYFLSEHKNVVQDELKIMLDMGIIEELHSNWSSVKVIITKTGRSVQFCQQS